MPSRRKPITKPPRRALSTHGQNTLASQLSLEEATSGLWPSTEPALDELRHSLQQSGCVFDFAVCYVNVGVKADEGLHRQALQALHAQILRSRRAHAQAVRLRHPELNFQEKPLRWQPELATASAWDASSLRDPAEFSSTWNQMPASDFEGLFYGFRNPPYPMRWQDGLFAEWCTALGLLPGEGVHVLDWVGRWNRATQCAAEMRCDWSNYFDDGLDWWGVWCLSIHNPQRQTLAALAASATD